MNDYTVEMARYGNSVEWIDIESVFKGLHYKKCEGLNNYGEPTNTYTETFAESNKADVYVSDKLAYKQTTIKLTLLFFCNNTADNGQPYGDENRAYHDFVKFISGTKIAYRDSVRKRKVLMILTSASEPSTDILYGQPYKEVTFTFTNIYGCSFELDEDFPE